MDVALSHEELKQKVKELEKKVGELEKTKEWLNLFSRSFERSVDGIAMGDIENKIIYANEALANMFGYLREEVVGKEISFIYADDQLPLLEKALQITMQDSWTGELVGKKKDGTTFPVSISSSRVLDENGNFITHLASLRDITQEKQILNALQESEAQKQAILDASVDRIRLSDTDMRIMWANKAYERELNISPEDLIGKCCYRMFVDRDTPCPECPSIKAITSGQIEHSVLTRHSQKNKRETVYLNSYAVPLKDESGAITRLIQITRNITEQVLAEKAIQESEQKYRTLFENSKDAISISTPDGNYIAFNQAFLDLFGYTEEDMKTMRAEKKYIDPNDRAQFKKEVEAKGSVTDFEVTLKDKNGEKKYCLMTSTLWRAPDGSILGYQGIIRDITRQRLAEEEIRESEEKWRTVFKQSIDALSITTRNGDYVYANQAFLDLFGYTEENIQNSNSIERYLCREDREKFIKEVEEKGSVKDYEIMLQKTNGDKMHTLCSTALRTAPDGSILGYQSLVRDITHERQMLEALRKSEAHKQAILDASVDRIRLVDTDMRILWANQTTTRDLHITPEDIIGKFCYEVFVNRDTPCPGCPSKKALLSGSLEHSILHQTTSKSFEGETDWENYSIPIKNESGTIESLIQITRNITEQVKAEKELRKSEEKYRTILESIEEGFYEVDLKGNFTFFNDSACKILGYSRDELLGMNDRHYTSKKAAGKLYRAFNRVYKTGEPKSIVNQEIIRKSGSRRDIETSISLIKNSRGKAVGFRGVFRDVTEKKRVERAIKRREQELAKVNAQLVETNSALYVLAKNLDITQKESEKRVVQKIRSYIMPIIEKLRHDKNIERYRADFDLLTGYIRGLTADLADEIKIALVLSNTELRVASLVKNGLSNQQIAKHLFITLSTVKTHRRNIRKKLDLHNSGVNLKTYMKSELD